MSLDGESIDDVLSLDHAALGRLLSQLLEGIPAGDPQAPAHLRLFREGLDRHMRWEEETLFPAVRVHATPAQARSIESLKIDHARLRETLDGLAGALDVADRRRAVELIGLVDSYLKGHNHDEEFGVYEEADRHLPAAERAALLARFRR